MTINKAEISDWLSFKVHIGFWTSNISLYLFQSSINNMMKSKIRPQWTKYLLFNDREKMAL